MHTHAHTYTPTHRQTDTDTHKHTLESTATAAAAAAREFLSQTAAQAAAAQPGDSLFPNILDSEQFRHFSMACREIFQFQNF